MKISINASERSLCTFAIDLGDKECERARKSLEHLHVDAMLVSTLQGEIGEVKTDVVDMSTHAFEWNFALRRALAICLRIYRDKINARGEQLEALDVETDAVDQKANDVTDFLQRLAGQEDFWRAEADAHIEASTQSLEQSRDEERSPLGAGDKPRRGRAPKAKAWLEIAAGSDPQTCGTCRERIYFAYAEGGTRIPVSVADDEAEEPSPLSKGRGLSHIAECLKTSKRSTTTHASRGVH